jgi:Tfp pilus assembly protein PilN
MLFFDFKLSDIESRVRRRRRIGTFNLNPAALLQDAVVLSVAAVAVVALVLVLFIGIQQKAREAELRSLVEEVQRDSLRLSSDATRADELRSTQAAIQSRVEAIAAIDRNRHAFVHVLDEVAGSIPERVWIHSIAATTQDPQSNHVGGRVSGYAPSADVLLVFIMRLELSPFVRDVRLASQNSSRVDQYEVVTFELTFASETPAIEELETMTLHPNGTVTYSRGEAREGSPALPVAPQTAFRPAAADSTATAIPDTRLAPTVGTPVRNTPNPS